MKTLLKGVIVIALLLLALWFLFIKYYDKKMNEPLSIQENKVLIKSISVGQGDTLYWYKYAELLHSNTMNFISIAKHYNSLTPDSADLQGEEIQDVFLSNDTIVVVCENDIEVFDKKAKLKVVKK